MKFSDRLKELRKKYNFSQAKLAEILDIGQRQISYYENDKEFPPLPSLIRLSNYFGVSLDYLSGRNDNPRYEDFIENAEIELFNEAEELIQYGINAERYSENELKGAVGRLMKNFYTSHKSKYTSPLAHLRLIFATREMANRHLNPKTKKVYLKVPGFLREASLWHNPVEYLKERGILPHEAKDTTTADTDRRIFDQQVWAELDKLEEEYISLNHREETEK